MNTPPNAYITVYTESNPNPNSLKFVINQMLVSEGNTYDFPDAQSAEGLSPLATELFNFDYVDRVFLMNNFVTVTKSAERDWYNLAPELKKFIQAYLEEGKVVVSAPILEEPLAGEDEPEINSKIRNILDEYVKPAVESDGGAISFHSFEEGTVKVLLQGSCSGCPSSTLTLKAGIENLLRSMLPEVKEVVAEEV